MMTVFSQDIQQSLHKHSLNDDRMFFDALVSNPPYQTVFKKKENAQNIDDNVGNIFQEFQKVADMLSVDTSMIYPGERWIKQSGIGMKKFGYDLINSPSLQKVLFYPHSHQIFSEAWISGGLTIVHTSKLSSMKNEQQELVKINQENTLTENTCSINENNSVHDQEKHSWTLVKYCEDGGIESADLESPGERIISTSPFLNKIIDKVHMKTNNFISRRKTSLCFFGLTVDFVKKNIDCFIPCDNHSEKFIKTPVSPILSSSAHLVSSSVQKKYVKVFVNLDGKRGYGRWYLLEKNLITKNTSFIEKWKVVVSSANLVGDNKRTPNASIFPPGHINGKTRIIVGFFNTEVEAKNYMKFLSTPFIRVMLASSGNYLTTFGNNAPDFETYINHPFIDFSKNTENINSQLLNYYGIRDNEKNTIDSLFSHLTPFEMKDTYDEE